MSARESSSPVPLVVGTISSAAFLDQYAGAEPRSRQADLVEARLDLCAGSASSAGPAVEGASVPSWSSLLASSLAACARLEATGAPVLVTIRLQSEGGKWLGRDEDRLPLFERALGVASWIDVETASPLADQLVPRAHRRHKKVVLSHHDFRQTPPLAELQRIIAQARDKGADVVKLAVTVNTPEDREVLLQLLRERTDDRLCLIGMGADAAALRVLFPTLGSVFAYAYLDQSAAPGQLSVPTMVDRLTADCPAYRERRGARAPKGE
jgi:3-dehydroquinate dehydratase-1